MSSTAAPSASAKKLRNAVIRLAGNSQDGIQSIGGILARLAGRTQQEVMTYMTIPSTISEFGISAAPGKWSCMCSSARDTFLTAVA